VMLSSGRSMRGRPGPNVSLHFYCLHRDRGQGTLSLGARTCVAARALQRVQGVHRRGLSRLNHEEINVMAGRCYTGLRMPVRANHCFGTLSASMTRRLRGKTSCTLVGSLNHTYNLVSQKKPQRSECEHFSLEYAPVSAQICVC
jgi:hypothetical protein